MGNHIKRRRPFRLATSWMLAVVLAGGGVPAFALQELVKTATAYAEEQQPEESALEVAEKNSPNDSAREAEAEKSQQNKDAVPAVVEASSPTEEEGISEEDEPSISFEADVPDYLMVTDASDSVDLALSTQNMQGLNIKWTVGLCVGDEWVSEHIFAENREYSVDQSTNTITLYGAKVLSHLGGYGEESEPNRLHVRIFAEAIDPSDPDGNPVVANATTWVDFFALYADYEIRFDGAPDRFVADDEQTTEELHLDWDSIMDIPGLQIVYTVGTWDGNNWTHRFTEGTEYTVDHYRNIVTLDGTEILNGYAGSQEEVKVRALAEVMNGNERLCECDHFITVMRPIAQHDQDQNQDQERELLPGWDGTVDDRFNLCVRDENHPDGEDFECVVTDVEVTAGGDLIDFNSDTWHYRAKELGTATLKVTYQRPDELGGGTGTYDLKLNIVADEYHFEGIGSQRHGGFILPGETADVWLQGYHQHAVKNDDGSWRIEESTDDLVYEWEMVPSRPEYDNIATMTVDENDPTHVTINAMVLEREPRPGAGVTVSAHLKHGGEGVARAGWTINICDSFPNFEPAAIDCGLGVGESLTIDPKLMWRERHDDGEIVSEPFEPEGLQLFWSYDTDAILITDAEGNVVPNSGWGGNDTLAGEGPYTVTRLKDGEAMLCLTARWPEGNDTLDCKAQYRFVAAQDVTAHKLEHVAAKTATLSATGHKEHWKCNVCGKLFLDEHATQATTLKDVTIAKLTNISSATITFPARTYNGSTQTTLPVVKIGDRTLARGTDYTVTGTTKATNAGTYAVTITGIGVYGGSRKASWTIAKAKSTISLAAQTKTYTGSALIYSGTVTKKGSAGAVTYAYYSDAACTKAVAAANVKGAGTYYVKGTVKADANHNAATSAAAKFTIAPKAQTISAANKSVAMGSKTVSLGAKVTQGSGALSYKSSATSVAKVSAKGIVTPVKVGTATITITAAAKGNYKATSKTVKVTVTKGAQPMTVKALTAKVALSKVKQANQKLAVSKVLTVAKAQGTVTYAKASGNAKITVNSKTGAVIVKKGLGKGTYSVKVQVKAAGNANWKAGSKTVTFKVAVK
ncbi:MAG: hypothetical protein IKG18_07250 [Atopobiaceae bacterium]|nr:hypothetical protein [Atopobiaceae bacterium]